MFDYFHLKRAQLGGKTRILCKKDMSLGVSPRALGLGKSAEGKNYEFRYTDLVFPSGIGIFKDTVATFSWGKVPRVFAIECKENADQYRVFFDTLWDLSQKP
jgi:hypothetical protein